MISNRGSLSQIEFLIKKHRGRHILLDANILLLYVVGLHDPKRIAKFKRTSDYDPDDFKALSTLLTNFIGIVTTPNILTEVSNYCGNLESTVRVNGFETMRTVILGAKERRYESRLICQDTGFIRLELTDTTILRAAKRGDLVLTGDLPLHTELQRRSCPSINFNHIRHLEWS